jgi:Zn-dependent protease
MNRSGSFRLFRLFGIDVSMHWTWILLAFYQLQLREDHYQGHYLWAVAEYLSLFLIVLMHEFGHALACRQVGGIAEHILLWPFGGIAFVQPPQRAGALLWSIVAGPLVNVALIPVFWGLSLLVPRGGNAGEFVYMLQLINVLLLVFNLLPIYPLDGGQILRAGLWFFIGRARSLMVAAAVGLAGAAGILVLAISISEWWLLLLAVLGAMQSFIGVRQARYMLRMMRSPKYSGVACPSCGSAPPAGPFWPCTACGQPFDHFARSGVCPRCGTFAEVTACPECLTGHSIYAWYGGLVESVAARGPAATYQPYTPPPTPDGRGSVPSFDRPA